MVYRGCNMDYDDGSMWFPSDFPHGKWKLDMSSPYERSVLVEILYLAAFREGCKIRSVRRRLQLSLDTTQPGLVRMMRQLALPLPGIVSSGLCLTGASGVRRSLTLHKDEGDPGREVTLRRQDTPLEDLPREPLTEEELVHVFRS
jgi:hypothetical protein